ncbi:MAG TPA: Ig-like domain-containing protein, partial [Pyrinomonadaceae bacterium]|nr:Ig-like domain-containing protein [Pyrinomonadaceae bacterium]
AITGTPSDPTLFIGVQKQNGLGAWSQPGGEILPQAPPPAGGPARKIESPDSHVQKVVFRNGSIYYCQTVGLPAGRQPTQVDRTAAQWTQLDSAANFVRGGRADDPGATATNGGKWYAFPSMSVNRFGDVLLGFTQFSSSQYPSAAYATHVAGDPPGSLRGPVVFKAGEGYYEKTLTGGRNLWGLYSGAQVDNVNDRDIWTIQQYAQQPAGIGPNSGRWGTWWERVPLPNRPPFVQITYLTPANQSIYIEGTDVEIRATASDPEGHVVAVEFFDGQAKIGDGVQISPGVYSITLPNVSAGTHTLTARAHDNEGGVGTSPPVTLDVRPVSILSDDFNDNSTDTWRWVIIGDRTRVLERNARLEITPPDNATGYPGYYARNLLNLTNRRATVEAVQVAPLIYGIETYFYLQEPYNGNHLMFATGGGGFILQSSANGEVSRTLISYNAAQHRFWRFRHDPADDSINFDMSPDGVTWTTYRKQPRPFNINALQAVLTCGKYTASTPAHTAVFDNYRVEDNPPSRVLLADDFNDNSADASKWFVDAPNGMTVAEQNQRLEVTPPAGNTGYGGYRSKATQDLTEATATVEVVQATPAVNGIETYFMLYESATGNYLLYAVGGMYLIEQSRDGAGVTRTYRPYDAAQHRRWRISHRWEDDTIAWETSPDGLTWTERRRAPRTFNVTALEVRLYAGKYTATTPASTAVFDNFRVERPRPALPPSDNFNDNSLDPARWVVYNPGSPSQVREQNQRLEISLQPNTVVYNGVVSAPAVNFWNKTFAVEVPQTTSQAGWVETFIMLWLDDNNFYQIVSGAGNVTADVMVNGAETRTVITYNAAAHRFWRMRHNAAAHTINFEVSGDGLSWTTFRTAPVVFSLDGMKLYLGAGAWGTGNSAPGTAIFDGAKLTPNE